MMYKRDIRDINKQNTLISHQYNEIFVLKLHNYNNLNYHYINEVL